MADSSRFDRVDKIMATMPLPSFRVVARKESTATKAQLKAIEKVLERNVDPKFEKMFPRNIPVLNDEGEVFYVNAPTYNAMFGTGITSASWVTEDKEPEV